MNLIKECCYNDFRKVGMIFERDDHTTFILTLIDGTACTGNVVLFQFESGNRWNNSVEFALNQTWNYRCDNIPEDAFLKCFYPDNSDDIRFCAINAYENYEDYIANKPIKFIKPPFLVNKDGIIHAIGDNIAIKDDIYKLVQVADCRICLIGETGNRRKNFVYLPGFFSIREKTDEWSKLSLEDKKALVEYSKLLY